MATVSTFSIIIPTEIGKSLSRTAADPPDPFLDLGLQIGFESGKDPVRPFRVNLIDF